MKLRLILRNTLHRIYCIVFGVLGDLVVGKYGILLKGVKSREGLSQYDPGLLNVM